MQVDKLGVCFLYEYGDVEYCAIHGKCGGYVLQGVSCGRSEK